MFLCVDICKGTSKTEGRKVFRFDFQPIGGFDLFVTGRSHFLLSERWLSFNNAIITLTSARWSARIVELAHVCSVECLLYCAKEGHLVEWLLS